MFELIVEPESKRRRGVEYVEYGLCPGAVGARACWVGGAHLHVARVNANMVRPESGNSDWISGIEICRHTGLSDGTGMRSERVLNWGGKCCILG